MSIPDPAALYARLHVGNPGDLAFYRARCAGASSILELGCGYGRVMESLARAQRSIVGIDRDRGLLELARARIAARALPGCMLVRADIRRFRLARRFERVLLPYSGLYCLPTNEDVVACFRGVREHLAPDGVFVFDAYAADRFHEGLGDEPDETDDGGEVARIEHEGVVYHVTESSEWDPARQKLDVVYVYEPRSGGDSIAARVEHHYLLSEQLEPLLEAAGLGLASLHGDYEGGTLSDDSELLVATARALVPH